MVLERSNSCNLSTELAELSNSLKIGKGDNWVRSIEFIDNSRSLCLQLHRPLNSYGDITLDSQYEHIIIPPATISVYFPKSPCDKPFCFCEDRSEGSIDEHFISQVSEAAELANEVLNNFLSIFAISLPRLSTFLLSLIFLFNYDIGLCLYRNLSH